MIYEITINPLEWLLKQYYIVLYRIFNSYGFGIIFMSISVSIFMIPILSWARRIVKRQKLIENILKPQLDKLNNLDDIEKRLQLTSRLYNRYSYNKIYTIRIGMEFIVQIPVLIASYFMLTGLNDLNGKNFLFIDDLSTTDGLLYGINIIPILMTIINIYCIANFINILINTIFYSCRLFIYFFSHKVLIITFIIIFFI